MDFTFALLGCIGGILCACGDLLLDLKGKDNKTLGQHGFIESNWSGMASWRFRVSVLLAMVGVPLSFLGFTAMAKQLSLQHESFAAAFWIVSLVGCIGGFFIHSFLCCMPLIYKTMYQKEGFEQTETVLNVIYDAIKIPFFLMYILLVGLTSLMLVYAVWAGYLLISPWWLLGTPLSLLMIGLLLRYLKRDWFYDLPGIIMPSLGLGMVGLMALLNSL